MTSDDQTYTHAWDENLFLAGIIEPALVAAKLKAETGVTYSKCYVSIPDFQDLVNSVDENLYWQVCGMLFCGALKIGGLTILADKNLEDGIARYVQMGIEADYEAR